VKRLFLWTLGLLLFVGTLWMGWSFRAGNATAVELDLIWIRLPSVELWRLFLVAIGLGSLLSAVIIGFAWMRSRLLNRRYRRVIRRLESELHELRSLPLAGSEPALTISDSEPE
jgi:uncharacterized membrane protein YciS (DUF1049 family)